MRAESCYINSLIDQQDETVVVMSNMIPWRQGSSCSQRLT
jgi:hypothetical protein